MERAGVFIGVDKTGGLQRLNDAAAGARRMHAWAVAQGMPDGTHARLITDEGGKVAPDQVFDAIKAIIDGPGVDQLVVYFAGHGVSINRSEQWLLTDAPARANAAIDLASSAALAQYSGIRHVVFMSDACRVAPEGIQAQGVRGMDCFPNDSTAAQPTRVDRFFACALGSTAAEIRDQRLAADGYTALYTMATLDALQGREPGILKSGSDEGDVAAYLWPVDLDRYLESDVPRRIKALGLELRLNQTPVAFVDARGQWLARFDEMLGSSGTASPGPRRGVRRPGRKRRGTAGTAPPDTLRSVVESLMRSAVEGDAASVRRRLRTVARKPIAGADALAASASQLCVPFGPDHFETRCGIKVRGARIVDYCAPRAPGAVLGPENELVRIDRVDPIAGGPAAAASALVCFEGDRGVVIPVFPGLIASLTFEEGELVDLAYEPSANDPARRLDEETLTERRALRAVAAAAFQHGRFRLEADEAEALDERVTRAGGVDPALAVYAAYAYWDLQRPELVDRTAKALGKELGATLFDLALLRRDMPAPSPDSGVVPFVPLLSRGWPLLRPHRARLHAGLEGIERFLRDSTWSLFGGDGLRKIRNVMQTREVR